MINKVLAQTASLELPSSIPNLSIDQYIDIFLRLILFVIFVAAFVAIVYSGIMMVTSNGDAAKFATARKNLIWAIVGIIIVILSYFIVDLVFNTFSQGGVPGPI